MSGKKSQHKEPSVELRYTLGIECIRLVLQTNRLRWFGHLQRKEDDDWTKT